MQHRGTGGVGGKRRRDDDGNALQGPELGLSCSQMTSAVGLAWSVRRVKVYCAVRDPNHHQYYCRRMTAVAAQRMTAGRVESSTVYCCCALIVTQAADVRSDVLLYAFCSRPARGLTQAAFVTTAPRSSPCIQPADPEHSSVICRCLGSLFRTRGSRIPR
jgi:hypothetical protein